MKKLLGLLLAVLTCLCFAACTPSNMEKAQEKMEEAGYDVKVSSEDAAELLFGEEAEASMTATKSSGGLTNLKIDTITAILFESSDAARAYYDDKKGEEEDEDEGIKQSGKWAYFGTEAAMEAFNK